MLNYKKLVIWFIVILLIVLTVLIILGISYTPQLKQVFIDPGTVDANPICQFEPTTCNNDQDCTKCSDNEEMYCVSLNRNEDQAKMYGKSQKYCLPKLPESGCNTKNGGIWTWTGWSDTNRMEWDCLCTYPEISGNPGCTELNPNVCQGDGAVWNYDASLSSTNIAPTFKNCKCGPNTTLLATTTGVPLCVPNSKFLCDSKESCEKMYSNSTYIQ